jgi:uncharacterized protein (UPF0335 family)
MQKIPSKNTNKKLRVIILMDQNGKIEKLCENYGIVLESLAGVTVEKTASAPTEHPQQSNESPEQGFDIEKEKGAADQFLEAKGVEIPEKPTDNFPAAENKQGIAVTEIVEGEEKRPFEEVKDLFDELSSVAGLDNKRYSNLIQTKFTDLQKYPDREALCFQASKAEINNLLNNLE